MTILDQDLVLDRDQMIDLVAVSTAQSVDGEKGSPEGEERLDMAINLLAVNVHSMNPYDIVAAMYLIYARGQQDGLAKIGIGAFPNSEG